MVLLNPEGEIVDMNQAYIDTLGYTREELTAKDSSFYTHPDDIPRSRNFFAALREGAQDTLSIEKRYFRRSGELLWARASGTVRRDESGRPIEVVAIVEDITARKRAETRYRFLAESIPQMVWTATPDGMIDYVNRKGTQYFGAEQEAVLGAGWLSWVHPDDQIRATQRWSQSLETGEPYESEFRLRRASDDSWRWHLARALPLSVEGGGVSQWFGTCTDIDDQRKTEEELRRINRELEEFSYVASHDLQEPLRIVNIYTQLLLKNQNGPREQLEQYSGFIDDGVRRMGALIQDLLTFSRSVQLEDQPLGIADLTAALREASTLLSNRIDETGAMIRTEALPMACGDTSQLTHVFQNILSNALKYRTANVTPEIAVSSERAEDQWIISVRDNGIGFDPQYAERIFGLFKRLHKDEYPGTGLGLAICKRIVERYGGRMWADARVGEGATFHFSLPCVPEAADAQAANA